VSLPEAISAAVHDGDTVVLPPGENELAVLRNLLATMPEKRNQTLAGEGASR
jgi:hypothetical protein